jgi:hypothetical protein
VAASYLIGFGRSGQLGGGSAFVDDDVFGAQKDNDPEKTRIRTDGSIGDPDDVPHTGQFTPGTYLVSGRANPIDGYQHCEDCDFIDWGWWGTRVEVAADASDEITEDRVDYVHMGTWVAGDILDPDDVPDEGGATFVGTALGTVARETDDGVAQYIARGNAQIGYDFVTRTADVEITDFDGMNVFGTGLDTSTTTQQLFSGSLTDCISCAPGEAELTGNFSGAIVGAGSPNVAAGAIGDFSFSGTNLGDNVSAVGTFATKQAF